MDPIGQGDGAAGRVEIPDVGQVHQILFVDADEIVLFQLLLPAAQHPSFQQGRGGTGQDVLQIVALALEVENVPDSYRTAAGLTVGNGQEGVLLEAAQQFLQHPFQIGEGLVGVPLADKVKGLVVKALVHQILPGGDKNNGALRGALPDGFRQVKPGYPGHGNVQKKQVKGLPGKILQQVFAVGVGSQRRGDPVLLQDRANLLFQEPADHRFIIAKCNG